MIITIASSKGGVGKTTVAINLAVALDASFIIEKDMDNEISSLNPVRGRYGFPSLNVVSPTTAKELLELLDKSDNSDIVVIDTGGFDSNVNRYAIAASDLVIIPTSDTAIELRKLMKYDTVLSEVKKNSGRNPKTVLLINRVSTTATNFDTVEQIAASCENYDVLTTRISLLKVDHDKAMSRGLSVLEDTRTKGGRAAREYTKLANEVKNLLAIV